ncbi:DUF3189 family protein [Alkaliphilus transvaalensis]|uniref:DUF3189 family protein n=1 Tax=Alkaliphilus transvaalensis TaxID=114628 RepID=UPI00047EB7C4|nr:DUF3189 family protein [Alkaliphilus transvaalensis]
MKIIYSCYGGAHTSIVAAAIHVGFLPTDAPPTFQEIATTPYYDITPQKDIGKPIFMGKDENENEVYVIGMGSYRKECSQLILEFTNDFYGSCRGKVLVVNSIALINLPIRIGGFLSKRMNLVTIGKPITIFGILAKYESFVDLVKNVKETVKTQP